MPDTSFHSLFNLKTLKLHDNIIEQIFKGTFDGSVHRNLEHIFMNFNSIKFIEQNTFANLESLRQIHLDDNGIETLDGLSFNNLENLQRLSLKGNKITSVASEAFHNLPDLEDLDLSYNDIRKLDFSIFDQVGTLSMFQANLSHNKLHSLDLPGTGNFTTEPGEC